MFSGGVTTWKPWGGGLAATICCSGGGSSGGGGALGGSRNTSVVSASCSFRVSAAPRVASTAPKMISTCSSTDMADWATVRWGFFLDSIS